MSEQHFTSGRVITVEAEIAFIETLIDSERVERMVNIATERLGPMTNAVHLMTLGTPLVEVRDILKTALGAVNDMIGPEKGTGKDPVHQMGKWYFWNETWADRSRPFDTEKEARDALAEYSKALG